MSGSLAYRKNEAAILRGDVPEKYTRLLPYIPGARVLEIGAAEGVLALLMVRKGKAVVALEPNPERYEAAKRLYMVWSQRALLPRNLDIHFANGRIDDNLHLLEGVDTLVAVRMIYYLRDELDPVFAEVARHIPNVVLCGNKNRAAWWRQGIPDKEGGPVNYYASGEGMRALLERHGYSIVQEETEGDPIVVGKRP